MKINKTNNTAMPTKPRKNIMVLIGIVIAMVVLSTLIFFGLRQVFQTEDYYILNQNISARTKVTAEMLEKVTTNKGGAPQAAISAAQVEQGDIYSKYPLSAGDILTESNTGLTLDTSSGIPDDWSVTTINIASAKAVGGQVKKGDYFDILVTGEQGSKFLATDVLALNVAEDTISSEDSTGKTLVNKEMQYTIGAPSSVIATITDAIDSGKFASVRIVLSPRSISYKERELQGIDGVFSADMETPLVSLKEGTDPSFTSVLRDNDGRPVTPSNCLAGIIQPEELCSKIEITDEDRSEHGGQENTNPPAQSETKEETQEETVKETQEETEKETQSENN